MSERYNGLPAFCPVHGLFISKGIAVDFGAMGNSFRGAVNCPICGRQSEIIPGVYDSLPEGMNLIVDPSVSPDALAALKAIAHRLEHKEITAEQAAEEARQIDPKFGSTLQVAAKIGAWAIPAVISLLTLYLQIQANGAGSAENAAILRTLTKQTAVLKQILVELSEEQADSQPKAGGEEKAKPEPKVEPTAEQPKSKRRAAVNKARQKALRLHREQFPPRKR